MKILIVKISSMGDIVHTMPIVSDILQNIEGAIIDWVAEESFTSMVERVSGIRNVIPVALRRWKKHLFSFKTWHEIENFRNRLRNEAYDQIIDFQGLLKSALICRMARKVTASVDDATNAKAISGVISGMANATIGSSYESVARFFYDKTISIPKSIHVIDRSRLLAAKALGYKTPSSSLNFNLKLYPLTDITGLTSNYIVFAHAASNAAKTWDLEFWINLSKKVIAAGYQVVLPWGNNNEYNFSCQIKDGLPKTEAVSILVLPALSLATIVDVLAGAIATIGVDTGLTHIASALDKPVVQLYRLDTAWRVARFDSKFCIALGNARDIPCVLQIEAAMRRLGVL